MVLCDNHIFGQQITHDEFLLARYLQIRAKLLETHSCFHASIASCWTAAVVGEECTGGRSSSSASPVTGDTADITAAADTSRLPDKLSQPADQWIVAAPATREHISSGSNGREVSSWPSKIPLPLPCIHLVIRQAQLTAEEALLHFKALHTGHHIKVQKGLYHVK